MLFTYVFYENRAAGLSVLGCCYIWCFVIESVCCNDAKTNYFFISRVQFSYQK